MNASGIAAASRSENPLGTRESNPAFAERYARHALANRAHDTGVLHPGRRHGAGRDRVEPASLENVRPVQAGERDFHERVVGADPGIRDVVAHADHAGVACARVNDRAH
jgi:hypothetical protein